MRRVLVPLLSIIVICSLGATLAVSVNGATLNVGSAGQYKSITEAVNAAQSGDTITVSPGTYSENVVVAKPVTIKAASPGSTTVTAADPSKDVFMLQGANIRLEGLTITGATGASGVHVNHASACVVTGITAHGNDKAVYLEGATNCEVSSSNLADNGYGVYCDNASHNTISHIVAAGEKGGSKALGDGIYMYYCDDNTVTNSNLTANHVFGISLYYSAGNTIANNSILRNEDIGTRLGWSNNNTLTYNTYSGNVNAGIVPVQATGNQIYLNNFVNQQNPVGAAQQQKLNSPQQLSYSFGGATHVGYMGNYYSDYKGSDSNGTGIGSTPSGIGDKYPLIQPFEKYTDISTGTAATSSASASPTSAQPSSASANATVNVNNSAAQASTPGFGVDTAFLAIGLVAFILAFLRLRRH
ncbi:MAG: right-handed parallel beta-helix repeat-containing protein [Halobacteriota archaeon]